MTAPKAETYTMMISGSPTPSVMAKFREARGTVNFSALGMGLWPSATVIKHSWSVSVYMLKECGHLPAVKGCDGLLVE